MKKIHILLIISLFTSYIFAEIPAGYYYKTSGKKGDALIDALNEICSNGKFLKYGRVKATLGKDFIIQIEMKMAQ